MAQDLRFVTSCDIHKQRHGVEVDAESYTLTLNGITRQIDLCHPCAIAYAEPLAKVMAEFGRWPSRVTVRKPFRSATGEYPCSYPDCTRSYRHKRTLRAHAREVHDLTLAELYRRHGDGGARTDQPEQPGEYLCPECGRAFTRNQGLGYHRLKKHGVPSATLKGRQ